MRSSGVQRVARGSAAAAASTFVALLFHVAGGGAVPTPAGIGTPLVLSVFVCVLLAGRRLPFLRLVVSVGASQLLFHALFVLGTPTGVSVAPLPGADAGHAHGVVLLSSSHEHPAGDGMWWAHLVSAAVTIVVLRRGEYAVTRLVATGRLGLRRIALDPLLRASAARPTPIVRAAAVPAPSAEHGGATRPVMAGSSSRRGPPQRLLAT